MSRNRYCATSDIIVVIALLVVETALIGMSGRLLAALWNPGTGITLELPPITKMRSIVLAVVLVGLAIGLAMSVVRLLKRPAASPRAPSSDASETK
jgi:hypothetical protein